MSNWPQQLREYAEDDCEVSTQKEFINSAADAFEKQEAEIEQLENINHDALSNLNDLCDQKNVEIDRLKGEAIGVEQEVAELRLFKHNMTLRYNAMNVDLAAYRNSFTAPKAQTAKNAANADADADAGRYRWLREHSDSMSLSPQLTVARVKAYGLEGWSGDDLNIVIDAAMKESQQ